MFLVILLFLKVPTPNTPVAAGLRAIDWTGSLLIVGSALMILLGLEFGDVTHPWSSATVICLLVFGVTVLGIFIVNEWRFAINPVIPLRLFSNRSSIAAYVVYSCNFYVLIGLSYYLPLYSQSVLGADALTSGIHLIPLIVSSSLAAACTGAFIQMTGIYLPIMYLAQVMLTLGAGLFINLHYGEGITKLIIFEVIVGIGVGMNLEPPLLAALAAATELDTAAVNGTMSFIRSIATSIAIVLGGVIFQNRMNAANDGLVDQLGPQIAGNFTGSQALASFGLIETLPSEQQTAVRQVYFGSLRAVWIMVSGPKWEPPNTKLMLPSPVCCRRRHIPDVELVRPRLPSQWRDERCSARGRSCENGAKPTASTATERPDHGTSQSRNVDPIKLVRFVARQRRRGMISWQIEKTYM